MLGINRNKHYNHSLEENGQRPLISSYSKASRYTASSCTDLAGALFWIGFKNIWAEWIYVVKPWAARFFDDLAFALLSNSSFTNFELHKYFHSPKNVHLKALLYVVKNMQNIVKSSTVRFEQGAFFAKQCAKQHVYFTLVKCHFGPSLL